MKASSFMGLLKGQRGFSLPEIMIGGGILAGVALAGATLLKDQRVAQKKVNEEQELAIFHKNLMQKLSNPFNCTATFAALGKMNQPASALGAGTITELSQCTGAACSDLKGGADLLTAGNASPLLRVNDWTDAVKQTWKVTAITNNAINGTGPFVVRVSYQLNPARFANSRVVTKDINLNARFSKSPALFQECLNSQESSVNNLQNDICKSMTSITSSGSVVAQWNDVTQKCEFKNSVKSCPAGQVIEGIRTDGSVRCVFPTNSGGACPSGQTPTFNPATKTIQCM